MIFLVDFSGFVSLVGGKNLWKKSKLSKSRKYVPKKNLQNSKLLSNKKLGLCDVMFEN